MVKGEICAVSFESYATHKVSLKVTACKINESIILFLYQGDDHLPQVHALLKCTKEFKIAGNVM